MNETPKFRPVIMGTASLSSAFLEVPWHVHLLLLCSWSLCCKIGDRQCANGR